MAIRFLKAADGEVSRKLWCMAEGEIGLYFPNGFFIVAQFLFIVVVSGLRTTSFASCEF